MVRYIYYNLFVEGFDDERYFSRVFFPNLINRVKDVKVEYGVIKYSGLKKEKVNAFLKSIKAIKNWDYLFFIDKNHTKCITKRKQQLKQKYSAIDINRIFVVIPEIEAWYLSGISLKSVKDLKLKIDLRHIDFNKFTKEQFINIFDKKPQKHQILTRILKDYDFDLALRRNDSLNYCFNKILSFTYIID